MIGTRMAPPAELGRAAEEARAWLLDAIALWADRGVDAVHGGFHDRLRQDGSPEDRPKRCRVQARQIYVFAEAGRLGWDGPWREIVSSGVRFMLDRFQLDSGAFRFQVTPDGAPLDEGADNYDQAFALFALAHAHWVRPDPELEEAALACLDFLAADRAHPLGGYFESGARQPPLRSNPHMHLLEAALAWRDRGSAPRIAALADTIAELAQERFIDPHSGALYERFDESWSRLADDEGPIIEPGHQFEWAWLLDRWDPDSPETASAVARLFEAGRRGVDRERHVAVGSQNPDGSIRDRATRLWPQTERLKAALTMARRSDGERRRGHESEAADAWTGLKRFLAVDRRGLWLDRLRADGSLEPEGAPASSLYHVVCGLSELLRYVAGPGDAHTLRHR